MREPQTDIPDWRDSNAYAPLLQIDRAGFAWEWLRRQDVYRQAAFTQLRPGCRRLAEQMQALEWNLHAFEDPRLPAPLARPVWSAKKHPWVLVADAASAAGEEDCFCLDSLERFATVVTATGGERLLLSDGRHSIRLDVSGESIAAAPVRLSYSLSGMRSLERQLLVLRRFRALVLDENFFGSLFKPVRRARRLVTLLRASDALRAGANHADLAATLLSNDFDHRQWRLRTPSLRSQAQRLARTARYMETRGFWALLD